MKYLVVVMLLLGSTFAQNDNIFPVTINETMPELTLTNTDGESININKLDNENILLIFPRGKVTENAWCSICQYQYFETIMIQEKLQTKYDMAIFYILPYSPESLQSWIDAIPNSLQTIKNWKYPQGENSTNENVLAWAEYSREFFPHSFEYDENTFGQKIPILFDVDQKVSNGLQIFRKEWGGTTVDQNVPTIFLLDKDRKVRFKYFSQYTNDRVSAEFLSNYIDLIL